MAEFVHNGVGDVVIGTKTIKGHDHVVAGQLRLPRAAAVRIEAVRQEHVVEIALPIGRKVGRFIGLVLYAIDTTGDHPVGIGDEVATREEPTLAVVVNHGDAHAAIGIGNWGIGKNGRYLANSRGGGTVRVGDTGSRLGIVVKPVVLQENIFAQGVGTHPWQIQTGGRAQHLVAVINTIVVGVRVVGICTRVVFVYEYAGVGLH